VVGARLPLRAARDQQPEASAAREIPIELRRDLEDDAARERARLHLVPDDKRATIAELVAAGDRAQMADKRFRRELAARIHPNRSRARRGMRGYGFGFGDLMSHAGPFVIRTFDIGKGRSAPLGRRAG
jgi:hypothetical protein